MTVPAEGPLLGLDVGRRWVGLAVSDPLQVVASGAGVIDRQAGGWLARGGEVARRHRVVGVVVGLPRRTDGSLGPEASRVQKLAARLEASLGLPLVFWDERLTTRQAEQALLEGGLRRERRRELVDQAAAVLILQGFLEAQRARRRAGAAPPAGMDGGRQEDLAPGDPNSIL